MNQIIFDGHVVSLDDPKRLDELVRARTERVIARLDDDELRDTLFNLVAASTVQALQLGALEALMRLAPEQAAEQALDAITAMTGAAMHMVGLGAMAQPATHEQPQAAAEGE